MQGCGHPDVGGLVGTFGAVGFDGVPADPAGVFSDASVLAGAGFLGGGYVVQKCLPHAGQSQNCCGGHGSSGPGSLRSIWVPHRWHRIWTSTCMRRF